MQTAKLLNGDSALTPLKNIFNDLDYADVILEMGSVMTSIRKCIYWQLPYAM